MPFPAADVSSGMNGGPTWIVSVTAPYTVRCSASRTACQDAELSRAGQDGFAPQPYWPFVMF